MGVDSKQKGGSTESPFCLLHHHPRGFSSDLHRKIRSPIPRVDLTHRGKIQAFDRSLDLRDIL